MKPATALATARATETTPSQKGASSVTMSSKLTPLDSSTTGMPLFLQPKLAISQPGDSYEQEADRVADQAMRMPDPIVQRQCAACAAGGPLCPACEEDSAMVSRKASGQAGTEVPASVHSALGSSGAPLPASMRAFFEPRFGMDLGHVRVHTDGEAQQSARDVHALAYTVGSHVVFSADRYAPSTSHGQRLLAHELAHVVQHCRGPAAVHTRRAISEPGDPAEREADAVADIAMRGLPVPLLVHTPAPVSRFPYQTVGTTLNRTNIVTLTGVSYWVQRTGDRYDVTQSSRMAADSEEQAAVFAALWASNPPATVTAHSERIVPINPRPAPAVTPGSPAPTAPPALLYRFKFDPPAAPGGKPMLECEFIATGPGAIPLTAPTPAAGFTPGTLSANSSGFSGGRDAYFAAHPQEFAQLMSFLAGAAPAVDQHLTTETRNTSNHVTHTSLLHVVRVAGTGGATASLDVDLIGEQAPLAAVSAPADYLTRDASDFEIEKLQRTSIAAANRLGPITLPAGLTPAEHLAVNLAITAYFGNGARNTEVDAIVPVGATGTATVLFTLRFGAANAVTVERIGAVGTGSGMVNTSRIDVRRIAGFPGITASDTALRAWWTARYPAGGAIQTPVPNPAPTPPNNTALLTEMNRLITAGIANTSWFNGNYGIELLDPTAASTRLRDVHNAPAATHATLGTLADGTKSFSAADMVLLELSLQTASTTVISALRNVKMIRMTNAITRSGTTWSSSPASTYGFTVMDGTERSTLLFDSFTHSDATLFRGGSAATALPDSTMTVLHELGHAAGYQGGVETAFNAWRAAHPQTAQTWYAASAGSEVFPEAFALFQTDPHFLCGSAPLLFAWFLEWTTTGTPPAASATLTAPTTCPP
jgi:hypothetical protein